MMRVCMLMVFCLALPAGAAQWGKLFYSPQERMAMMDASVPMVTTATVHVFSAKTIAAGHLRRWVDAASQSGVRIPPRVRVGDTWQEPSP